MFLTEEEAKKHLCPFFKYVYNEDRVFQDREPAVYVHQNCMGSDCGMGWRWSDPVYEYNYISHNNHDPVTGYELIESKSLPSQSGEHGFDIYRRLVPIQKGYCGMVGKPNGEAK